jgi:K+-sensing histidine kinase KdpD
MATDATPESGTPPRDTLTHQTSTAARGNLRFFLAESSNVGVVLAMLRAVSAARSKGVDVVVGQLALVGVTDAQARKINKQLLKLQCTPLRAPRVGSYAPGDIEFDLRTLLKRQPAVVATSKPVFSHLQGSDGGALEQWFEMVETLLQSGIDVWATIHEGPARVRRRVERRSRTSILPTHSVSATGIR